MRAKPRDPVVRQPFHCGRLWRFPACRQGFGMDQKDALYRAVIGRNAEYYLERFRGFDAAGKAGASWHWPAFFITFFWLLYRKMWGAAAAYVVLVLASYLVLPTVGMIVAGAGGALAALVLHLVLVL